MGEHLEGILPQFLPYTCFYLQKIFQSELPKTVLLDTMDKVKFQLASINYRVYKKNEYIISIHK